MNLVGKLFVFLFFQRANPLYRVYISRRSLFLVRRKGKEKWITRDEFLEGDTYLRIWTPGRKYRRTYRLGAGHYKSAHFGEVGLGGSSGIFLKLEPTN